MKSVDCQTGRLGPLLEGDTTMFVDAFGFIRLHKISFGRFGTEKEKVEIVSQRLIKTIQKIISNPQTITILSYS